MAASGGESDSRMQSRRPGVGEIWEWVNLLSGQGYCERRGEGEGRIEEEEASTNRRRVLNLGNDPMQNDG